jgi:competence protein ComEC
MKFSKYIFYFLLLILLGVGIAISQLPDDNLHIIVCDVGQGDAILFVYKNIQVLTDGGPDSKVISCLGKYMPFWDREVELVISTHPDADHSTGLIDVIKKYKVDKMLINPIDSGTQTIKVLQNLVKTHGIGVVSPIEGQEIRIGLIYLDIVNPSASQINALTEKIDTSPLHFYKPIDQTNEYSISYKLSFGKFSGLFTGDFGPKTSDRLADAIALSEVERVNYIKIPHHGSKNGITANLLKELMPKTAVISVGKKNRYGHPHQEILDMLAKYNVRIFRTDKLGDVEFITDGEKYWMRK